MVVFYYLIALMRTSSYCFNETMFKLYIKDSILFYNIFNPIWGAGQISYHEPPFNSFTKHLIILTKKAAVAITTMTTLSKEGASPLSGA